MTFQIDFTRSAAKQVDKLDPQIRHRILNTIGALSIDPQPRGARKLVGELNAWRIRVGDYRVIYEITDQTLTITVVRLGHRREAYRP